MIPVSRGRPEERQRRDSTGWQAEARHAANDLVIRCRCGSFSATVGQVSGADGNRAVCYCDDCQAFASYLGAEGWVLDPPGGTDIFQMSPARLSVGRGIDRLACVRMTPRGPLRWYADCCRSPIGNTAPTRHIPIVSLVVASADAGPRALDQALGPVHARVMARHARTAVPGSVPVYDGFPSSHIVRMLWKCLIWRIRGDHRRSPFFDPETGRPVAAPRLLSRNERA